MNFRTKKVIKPLLKKCYETHKKHCSLFIYINIKKEFINFISFFYRYHVNDSFRFTPLNGLPSLRLCRYVGVRHLILLSPPSLYNKLSSQYLYMLNF